MPPKILSPALPTHLIHQFPIPTWIENLAIRSNGSILCTLLTSPDLYLISPTSQPAFSPKLIHTSPSVLALTGIVESATTPAIFYVAGGNFNCAAYKNEPGTYLVWEIDLSRLDASGGGEANVREICAIPESGLLNGMCLAPSVGAILIADSEVGCVWRVEVGSGAYEKVLDMEEMKPLKPPGLNIGINGIKVRDGWLYWSNTGKKTFSRVGIDEEKQVGDVEVLVRDCLVDDFCFDKNGNAWLATNVLNTVAVIRVGESWDVKEEKEVLTVAGAEDELTAAGGTACQFGRKTGLDGDEHILYMGTTGGLAAPIKGSEVEGGKLIGTDTRSFVG